VVSLLDDIDGLMAQYEVDALFLEGKSLLNTDLYYMTRFLAVDPTFYVKQRDQPGVLAAIDMVCERAKHYSPVRNFHSVSPTWNQAIRERVRRDELERRVIEDIAKNLFPKKGVIGIPRAADAQHVHNLQQLGIQVKPVQSLFFKARETKDKSEIEAIKKASQATETTFRHLIDIFQNTEIGAKHVLFYEKKPLTVGRVKRMIEHSLVDNDSENSEESIVAAGSRGADYHYLGLRDDILHAHEPIIIDIFPRRLEERYHADITRTFVRGNVSKKLNSFFESVEAAFNAVVDALNAGGTAEDLTNAMADSYERNGHQSANRTPGIKEGMLHSLGHGIGLNVHEFPSLSLQPTPLLPGAVIAVEPALYYQKVGGIRLEEDFLVTSKGAQTITKLPRTIFL
jgi:Xaa-Pro aminopeptidase